jgi:hypothetical protein
MGGNKCSKSGAMSGRCLNTPYESVFANKAARVG